jgi:hypothetical protein
MSEYKPCHILIIGAISENQRYAIERALKSHTNVLPIPENVKVVVVSGTGRFDGQIIAEDMKNFDGELKLERNFEIERYFETPELKTNGISSFSDKFKEYDRRYLPKFNNSKNKKRK